MLSRHCDGCPCIDIEELDKVKKVLRPHYCHHTTGSQFFTTDPKGNFEGTYHRYEGDKPKFCYGFRKMLEKNKIDKTTFAFIEGSDL